MEQLLKSDYFYELPEELIAQDPLGDRASSRLMVLNKKTGEFEHRTFKDIKKYLRPGDCLVLNNTRVIPARLMGTRKDTGAVIEVLLLKRRENNTWETLVKPGKKARVGQEIIFGDGLLTGKVVGIEDEGNRIIEFSFEGIFEEILDKLGEMPLPPYITHKLEDKNRYQTVYAKYDGSAAAPTAGLHFTNELLDEIREMGVKITFVTLHVGLGTFRPVKEDNLLNHHMHSEWYQVTEEAANTINETKAAGGRIICVGTTSTRTLESAADDNGIVHAGADDTEIFIYPGYKFKVLDCLITNFHLPESTLIMLVSALAGRENVLNAYKEAVKEKYRFFSFGDAMFLTDDLTMKDPGEDKKEEKTSEEGPSEEKQALKGTLERFTMYSLLMVFLETVFHIWTGRGIDKYFFVMFAMCLPTAAFLSLFSIFFKAKANKVVSWCVTGILLVYYVVNILYKSIFKVYFSVLFINKNNAKVAQYYREIFEGIRVNWLVLSISVLLPIAAIILVNRLTKINRFEQVKLKGAYVPVLLLGLAVLVESLVILSYGKDTLSPYELCVVENSNEESFERLGVVATGEVELKFARHSGEKETEDELGDVWVYSGPADTSGADSAGVEDGILKNDVSEGESETVEAEPEPEEEPEPVIDTSPNMWDIDFVSLKENESDEYVASIHNYMSTLAPTNKNEYTGMFEGFNLIFMTAEAFSSIAVDPELTPTLYRLTHEGFVFNNFYNPRTGGSTSDGEFVCTTSLYPMRGGATNYKAVGQNQMPLALGNMFNMKYGITSRAYHDNDYMYYGRDISYPAMGYYYQGVGNGLEIGKHWPASDLEMMEATVPEYIDDDIFNVYYMTVSGHLNYNFSGNYCSAKNKEAVKDLDMSEPCKAYMACQMELDKACEYLINALEEKGIADRTVICFTGDHWPYGLENEEISELLGHEVEETFELYKSNLILWSGAIEEPIVIDKPCCSMDIVPTLLNLFGFDFDSRLLMGQDILSDNEGFVAMWSKSIITDTLMYDNKTGDVTYLTEDGNPPADLPEDYLSNLKLKLAAKRKYSERIVNYDYYKYICDYLGMEIPVVEQNYTPDYGRFTK